MHCLLRQALLSFGTFRDCRPQSCRPVISVQGLSIHHGPRLTGSPEPSPATTLTRLFTRLVRLRSQEVVRMGEGVL